MKELYYILRDGEPTPVDFNTMVEWRTNHDEERKLWQEYVGDVWISTVFLVNDHRLTDEAAPVLWETLVFGGTLDHECVRYTSKQDARVGHVAMVERVKAAAS